MKGRNWAVMLLTLIVASACTAVDETEHCVETRYGKIVTEKMSNGLNGTVMTQATCFPTTEQNFALENVEITTKDPVTLKVSKVTVLLKYNTSQIPQTFMDKRKHENAMAAAYDGAVEAIKNSWSTVYLTEVYGTKKPQLSALMKQAIQSKLGSRFVVNDVILAGNITGAESLERQRVAAMEQDLAQNTARKAFQTDSLNNLRKIQNENTAAEVRRLQARVYEQNPAVLRLEIAREQAKLCGSAQTCVLGGSVLDLRSVGSN
jgi:hypothetical protein